MVVVEEDDEEPDVLARGLGARVIARSDLERGLAARLGLAVQPDELHGVDLLADAVLLHLEIGRGEAGDGLVAAADDRDVHADHLHACAEDRRLHLLLLLWRLLGRRLLLWGRLLSRRAAGVDSATDATTIAAAHAVRTPQEGHIVAYG